MAVLWVVMPCSLIEGDLITLTIKAARNSETSVNLNQNTWSNIPEDSHLIIVSEFDT
jgi:hypothetical protein